MTAYERRQSRSFSNSSSTYNRLPRISDVTITQDFTGASVASESSPMRIDRAKVQAQPSLFDQAMPEVAGGDISFDELEVERQLLETSICVQPGNVGVEKLFGVSLEKHDAKTKADVRPREVFGDKENILPAALKS